MTFIKKNKFFLIGLLILAWVIFINLFPNGYIISSTDTSQIINIKETLREYFFDFTAWTLYLIPLWLLSFLESPDTLNLSYTLGFFILGAYLSFYAFTRLFFKKSDLLMSAFSLIYALNVFTLYTFTMHGLGYTPFYYLYLFVPLLIGFYLKFLQKKDFLFLAFFCLALFLASPGFGNPAFALGLILVLFFLTIFLLLTRKINWDKKLFWNLFLLAFFSFLVSAFWILVVLPGMRSGVEDLNSTNPTNLLGALMGSGNQIADTLGINNSSHNFFPLNFQYQKISFLKNIFIFLTYLPIILIFFFIFYFKKLGHRKIFFSFLALIPLLILGVAKMIPPFEILNYFIFAKVWGMNTLRASDKLFIFLPFFLIASLFIVFNNLDQGKYKKLIFSLLILLIITPLPFYLGKLQQTVGARLSSGKDYQTSKLTFLVKIPDEYKLVKSLTKDERKVFIATLPNNLGWTGTGSTNLPKWKLHGIDATQRLSGRRYIEANYSGFPNWIFASDFNEINSEDEAWIVKLLGMMNAKYILYHKDAPDDDVEKSLPKMKDLESRGMLKNLEENEFFILYEISDKDFIPYLTWQNETFAVQGNIASIERTVSKIKASASPANFQEINPKKFEVAFENVGENLVLAETFNPLWKAYYKLENGKEIEIKEHFKARGYANGWAIDKNIPAQKIIVEYYPIRLMWRGIWINSVTVLFLIGYLLYYFFKNKKSSINSLKID